MTNILRTLSVLVCTMIASGIASSDEVFLKDGSLLVGTLQGFSDGILRVDTTYAGKLSIPWEHVDGISTQNVFLVNAKDGNSRSGTLNTIDGKQYFQEPSKAQIPLGLKNVTSIKPPSQSPKDDTDTVAPGTESGDNPAPPEKHWSGRAEFGLNGQSGNKERVDIRLGIDLNRKLRLGRLNVYLKGQYAETNSEKSANEVLGGTRIEVDFSERTYAFGKVDFEYDEFEDLDLRTTLTVGLGHFFIKREKMELKGWVGAGYEYEQFTRDPEPTPRPTTAEELVRQVLLDALLDKDYTSTESSGVVEIGYNFRKDVKHNFRLKHGVTFYPSLNDPTSEYRFTADTALEFPLGKEPDWTLRAGVRNDYDAMPEVGIDKLDTTYYLNLGYNW
jgi:putative salt-induced outer membrane protein YdiY